MKTHTKNIAGIEALRGVAALMVLLYHLVELLKVPLPGSLAFVRTHFGLGVPLFYALSGFVLAYGYSGGLISPRDIKTFYIRRLFRIAPLFYFMLVLWLVVNWLVWDAYSSPLALLLNLTLTFGLVPGMHESVVWAGWSIGIEVLFYLVFPIIALLTPGVRSALFALVMGCVLSGATYAALAGSNIGNYAYMNLVTQLPNFLCGVLVYHLWQRADFRTSRWGALMFAAAIVMALLLIREPRIYVWLSGIRVGFLQQNVWVAVFGLLILSSCVWHNPLLLKGPLRSLGKVSFSLYLVHPMLMLALMKIGFVEFLGRNFSSTSVQFLVGAAFTIGLVWLVSYFTYRFIEAPGMALGKRIAARLETGSARSVVHDSELGGLPQDRYAR